jgi:hypothetical protein
MFGSMRPGWVSLVAPDTIYLANSFMNSLGGLPNRDQKSLQQSLEIAQMSVDIPKGKMIC